MSLHCSLFSLSLSFFLPLFLFLYLQVEWMNEWDTQRIVCVRVSLSARALFSSLELRDVLSSLFPSTMPLSLNSLSLSLSFFFSLDLLFCVACLGSMCALCLSLNFLRQTTPLDSLLNVESRAEQSRVEEKERKKEEKKRAKRQRERNDRKCSSGETFSCSMFNNYFLWISYYNGKTND